MSDQNNSLYENSNYPSRRQPTQSSAPKRKKKRRRNPFVTFLKFLGTLFLIGLCTGAILCCFGATYIKNVIVPLADLSLDDFVLGENSVMYYTDKHTGETKELVTLLNTTSSIWVDYEDMPQNLINAAVAIEDQRFWTHPGVDWRRTGRAVLDMFTGNSISGGSTITQQLIKNLTDENETTVKRKVTEIVRALRFTQNNSKQDTITWYLNIIPLGSGCEGVGSAALEYFGKDVSELSLAECASLISITNNPSKYSPYSSARVATKETGELWTAKQWNKWRQENVLREMLKQGMISQAEHDAAVAEELQFVRGENTQAPQEIYSWYEETVISDVTEDLKQIYGLSTARISQLLSSGGLRIYTCLDPEIQAIAEEIYTNRENLNYTSANGNLMQSSITIIDNATGDVVAIVGQFGQKQTNLLNNFANDAKRQPGSSLKPLSVYSPALEMGLISPITIIDDYPYRLENEKPWPLNSGAAKYKGLTTVKQALTQSVNTIAVRILQDRVTPEASFDFVENVYKLDLVDAYVTNSGKIQSDRDTAPLAMGGLTDGVCTRDMAEAFATFPNNGVYTYSRTYTRVEDVNGNVILEKAPAKETVIKDTTAYYINDMLTNVVIAGTGTSARLSNMTSAGKTGTTSNNFDRWFVGYTPYYTAAVWTGYEYNEKMNLSGGNPSAILWKKVMDPIHEGLENKKFPVPNGLVTVDFCLDSGLLPNEYCQMDPRGNRVSSATIHKDDAPDGVCTVHTAESVVKVCVDCPILDENEAETGLYHIAGPYCPEESLREICLPNYAREPVGTATSLDEKYRLGYYQTLEVCTVHIEEIVEPDPNAPLDPSIPWDPSTPYDPADPNPPFFPWHPGEQPPEEQVPPVVPSEPAPDTDDTQSESSASQDIPEDISE